MLSGIQVVSIVLKLGSSEIPNSKTEVHLNLKNIPCSGL